MPKKSDRVENRLRKMIGIIGEKFKDENISYAIIGAIALGTYGLPRYTADIDLIAQHRHDTRITEILERTGYTCLQKTDTFAQFDSELGVFGKVDVMFMSTPEGLEILARGIFFKDEVIGEIPVIQPTDYIILKLMALANEPRRITADSADIVSVLRASGENQIPEAFEPLDLPRIHRFAERFGQLEIIRKLCDPLPDASRGANFRI